MISTACRKLRHLLRGRSPGREADEHENLFQGMVESAPDAMIFVDRQGQIAFVNAQAESLFGYRREELLARPIELLVQENRRGKHAVDRGRFSANPQARMMAGGRKLFGRRKDGSEFPAEVTLSPVTSGGRFLISSAIRDVTERHRIEDDLRSVLAQLEFQRFALDQHAIVAVTDARGRIVYANDKFCEISQYSREELLGRDHRIVNSGHHPKSFFKEMYATITQGNTWHGEICNRAKDGSIYWVDATIVPFKNEAGQIERYVAIRADITERKKAEEQNRALVQQLQVATRSLEAKNKRLAELYDTAYRFVADVSHEFRTPLTVIKEFAGILEDGLAGALTPEQREYVGYIAERADDLSAMVSDLLDLSRSDAGMLRAVRRYHRVADITEHALGSLRRKADTAKVTFDIDLPADPLIVYCDAEKIGRVLINLTVNALKYTPEAGRIRVWAGPDPDDPTQVRIGVTDSGPGISAEDQARLFQRFRQIEGEGQAVKKGFGLGLNIARELVRLNLGEMQVESEHGRGSTFWFTLPNGRPMDIAARYLKHRERESPGSVVVSLLAARTATNVSAPMADEMDDLMQRILRPADLLLRTSADTQLLLAAMSDAELPSLVSRIETVRAEANRNRPGGGLPTIQVELLRVWRSGENAQPLLDEVAAAMAPVGAGAG